jgi:hypothetical protein
MTEPPNSLTGHHDSQNKPAAAAGAAADAIAERIWSADVAPGICGVHEARWRGP